MAKTNGKAGPKLKRLPRQIGKRRETASTGFYEEQKAIMRERATRKGMTLSYYMMWLMHRDWLDEK
jgi:hypothetical protein